MRFARGLRIERYVLLQLLFPFILVLLVSTVVIVTSEFFGETVRSKLARGITPSYVIQLFALLVPHMFLISVPVAWLLSILITYGRMSEDFEVAAAQSVGISWTRLFAPVFFGSAVLTAAMLAHALLLAPMTKRQARLVMHKLALAKPTLLLRPNSWLNYVDDMDIWIGRIDDEQQVLHDLQIYRQDDQGRTQRIAAARGYIHLHPAAPGSNAPTRATLELRDGTLHQSDPDTPDTYSVMHFSAVKIPFNHGKIAQVTEAAVTEPSERALGSLLHALRASPNPQDANSRDLWIELGKRTAWPFASLTLAFIGVPLGIRPYRSVRAYGTVVAIFLGLSYIVLMEFARDAARVGWLHPFVSMWMPNLGLSTVGIIALQRIWKR